MARLAHSVSEIIISDRLYNFNKEIRIVEEFETLIIFIFQGDYPPKEKYYNNVLAVESLSGQVLWEVELDEEIDFANPYEGVADLGPYFIFFKANSGEYAVNKLNGKLLKNIDLISGSRPW